MRRWKDRGNDDGQEGGAEVMVEGRRKQTCDGNLSRPLAGSVKHRLVHGHHVANVALVLHVEDIPIYRRNKVHLCLLRGRSYKAATYSKRMAVHD